MNQDRHSQRLAVASVVLFSIVCLYTTPAFLSSGFKQNEEIILTEGTAINVVTAEEISSKTAKPNDPVNFKVAEDLVLNGRVLINKGTLAKGSVINAEKGGYMGKSGKLGIQVESTQTVDGQPLKLRAAKGKEGNDKTNSTASST